MRCLYLLVLVFLFQACSTAQFPPAGDLTGHSYDPELAQKCEQYYIRGSWQFVHSITFKMANGRGATVIGVTVLGEKSIKTALMGVEGFVLFEAELDAEKNFTVIRALPPFDNSDFASGLMRDVKAIFVSVSEEKPVTAQLDDGVILCRSLNAEQMSDFILQLDGSSRIHIYDADGNRIKTIMADGHTLIDGVRIPKQIQLSTYGLQAYTLKLELISAQRIN